MAHLVLNKVESKIDKLDEKLDRLAVIQAKQEVILDNQHKSLVEHMRRSDLLEKKLIPLERHVSVIHGGMKFVGFATTIATAFVGFIKLLQMVRGG